MPAGAAPKQCHLRAAVQQAQMLSHVVHWPIGPTSGHGTRVVFNRAAIVGPPHAGGRRHLSQTAFAIPRLLRAIHPGDFTARRDLAPELAARICGRQVPRTLSTCLAALINGVIAANKRAASFELLLDLR